MSYAVGMAYLRDYKRECDYPGCSSVATKELVNRVNATLGYYCTRHAKTKLAEAQRREGGAPWQS